MERRLKTVAQDKILPHMRSQKLTVCVACLATLSLTAGAQDWPQWRGPHRDGVAHEVELPVSWPKALQLKWTTEVGTGYSSPVVVGDSAYVHTRTGDDEVAARVDLATGKIVWRAKYAAPFEKNKYATGMAKGPHSTPTIAEGRMYTFGVTSILSCFDTRNGTLLWRKDFSKQTDSSNLFTGTAMSPLVDSGRVIVHKGDDRGGSLVAFSAATGEEKWTLPGDGPGYASPVASSLNGPRHFVTLSDRSIVGVAIASGQVLWRLPFKDEWNENIVTPVVYRDTLIFSGVRKPTNAYRWFAGKPLLAWANTEVSMYMSSPVIVRDYLYGLSAKKKGQYFCLDARTGKTMWLTNGREANQASFVAVNDALLILTDAGDLIVARALPKGFEQVARYQVAESATYAQPVVLNHRILVKDENSLRLWQVD
jgi:outer membrane protein assembly factor BamB